MVSRKSSSAFAKIILAVTEACRRSLGRLFSSATTPSTGSNFLLDDVVTVFSDVLHSIVPDPSSRRALFHLRRSLNSIHHPSDFASALSRHATLLLNPHSWLFFLHILQRGSNPACTIQAFEWKMMQPNVSFTPQEYAAVIRVAGKLGMLVKAKNLYLGMATRGVNKTIEVENSYMYAHAYDSGNTDCAEALNVFQRLQDSTDGVVRPNLVSFNIALCCYSKRRHLQHLEKTFEDLIASGYSPSAETYNCLMLAYRRLGYWWRVEELFCTFQSTSLKPTALTFGTLIRAYAAAGLVDRMEKAYNAMLAEGYLLRAATAVAVIAAYKKAGELTKMGRIMFINKARGPQRVMSNLMLRSPSNNGKIESMEAFVEQMLRSRRIPFTSRLAVIIVKAYFKSGKHERIRNFVEAAQHNNWNLNRSFFNTLIYLYAEEEGYAEIEWYFERMVALGCPPNHRTLQMMHQAYLKADMEEAAEEVLTRMQAMGLSQT